MTKLRNVALILLIGFSGIGFTDCDEATSPPISAGDLRIQHRLTVLSLGSRLISPYSVNTS